MTDIICSSTACSHNDGKGNCEKQIVYISDAETGKLICSDAQYEDDLE